MQRERAQKRPEMSQERQGRRPGSEQNQQAQQAQQRRPGSGQVWAHVLQPVLGLPSWPGWRQLLTQASPLRERWAFEARPATLADPTLQKMPQGPSLPGWEQKEAQQQQEQQQQEQEEELLPEELLPQGVLQPLA